jgi:hypothetical protein
VSLSRLRLGEHLAALGPVGSLVVLFALNWYCEPTTGGWVGVGASALTTPGAYLAMRAEQGWTPGPGRGSEVVELPGRPRRAAALRPT